MRRLLPVDWTVEGLLDELLVEQLSTAGDGRWYRTTRDAIDIGRGELQDSMTYAAPSRWLLRRDDEHGGDALLETSSSWALGLHLTYEWVLTAERQAALRAHLALTLPDGVVRVAGEDWMLWGDDDWLHVLPHGRRRGHGALLTRMVHAFQGSAIDEVVAFVRALPPAATDVQISDAERLDTGDGLELLLRRIDPRVLDMLVPDERFGDGRRYFGDVGRLVFAGPGQSDYEVRLTDDGRYWVTFESRHGLQEVMLTDSLRAVELFALLSDLEPGDRRNLEQWVRDRRESPQRDRRFEHRWSDGSSLRGGPAATTLPELVEEFDGHELSDVMDVVEYLRRR